MESSSKLKKWYTLTAVGAVCLIVAQVLLVLLSWIISSVAVEEATTVRSLLSNEGIRQFFGTFVAHAASPPLVWLILLALAWGAYRSSGLSDVFRSFVHGRLLSRQRFALSMVAIELLVIVVVVSLLTFVPHAILLGSLGTLFPSPFSRAIVPVLAFAVILCSLTYGVATGRQTSLSDIMSSLTSGFPPVLPLFVLWFLASQLFYCIQFVFFGQ